MRRIEPTDNLEEFRIRASRLRKELNSTDNAVALGAAGRFRVLPALHEKTREQIVSGRSTIQRKHALAVIAKEAGFESWTQLRRGRCPAPRLYSIPRVCFSAAARPF